MRRVAFAAVALSPLVALAQRYNYPPVDAGVSGVAATFAALTFMGTAWATLAEGGPWHKGTQGYPWIRALLVLGPPVLIGWLLS